MELYIGLALAATCRKIGGKHHIVAILGRYACCFYGAWTSVSRRRGDVGGPDLAGAVSSFTNRMMVLRLVGGEEDRSRREHCVQRHTFVTSEGMEMN